MFKRTTSSLKLSLTLPYAALVAAMALLLMATFYVTGSRSVYALSEQLVGEMLARISLAVFQHVSGAHAVLETAFPNDMPADRDIVREWDGLRTRFWIATSLHTNPNDYIYYGNRDGQGFGLKRLGPQDGEIRVKFRADDHRGYYRFHGPDGLLDFETLEEALFDPRSRIWYKLAKETSKHIWTVVYIDFGTQDLVMTRARRVLSSQGAFEGVVATDVSLREVGAFINSLDVGKNGRAFLVEHNGMMIAGSGLGKLALEQKGQIRRAHIDDLDDPVLRPAFEAISPLLNHQPESGASVIVTTTDRDGRAILVGAREVVDEAGLDWIAVVALPRSDVLAGLFQQMWLALAISVAAVSLIIFLGLRLFGTIARDVMSLSRSVSHMRSGQLDVTIDMRREDEVGALARDFKAMHTELFTDRLTGLSNRAALSTILATAIGPDRPPFILFFIDLNRFKPLNDCYGHDNGDRALAEIAARLQACLRPGDRVARLGGDEFVVLTWGADAEDAAEAIVTKLVQSVEVPLTSLVGIPEDSVVTLGAAIGYARWPQDAADGESLLKQADQAMYRNKPPGSRDC